MQVNLISITPDAEKLIAYCARVSSNNQYNPEYKGLLNYCMKHGHWSPFQMADITVEIETSRAIAQQILRHRSFHFQEFSQRYAKANTITTYEARRQDDKNRQNSIDDLSKDTKEWWYKVQAEIASNAITLYNEALAKGIAKECARFILPLNTDTKLYMKGTVRDWIHYINLRTGNGTQKEHMDIASSIKSILIKELPTISQAIGWTNEA